MDRQHHQDMVINGWIRDAKRWQDNARYYYLKSLDPYAAPEERADRQKAAAIAYENARGYLIPAVNSISTLKKFGR